VGAAIKKAKTMDSHSFSFFIVLHHFPQTFQAQDEILFDSG
jgi:hypothetical protein